MRPLLRFPFLLLPALALLVARPARSAAPVTVTVLQTSDVHGRLLPWDYSRARPDDVGLARIATRVAAIRRETPNVLLLDGGDTIQGSPLGYLHARRPEGRKDPMSEAMSAMRYDAMAVGNHEFNYGLDVLRRAEADASFPWLSANTLNAADRSPAFPEYVVKTFGKVRVGVLGLTTPNVPGWEPEKNRPGLTWEDPVETARRLVPVLRGRERCDLVVVLIHSGLEVDLASGKPDDTAHENRVAALARSVPGVDLILTGHTHRRLNLVRVEGVPVTQPGRWGEALARVDLKLARAGGRWKVVEVTGELLPSDDSVPADPGIERIAAPHHARALAHMEEVLARAEEPLPAAAARLGDSPLLDLVNEIQRSAAGSDLSMTSLLPGWSYAGLPAGEIRVRDVYALYPYENELSVLEVDGAILKECLENAAGFYADAAWEAGRLVVKPRPGVPPYSFDAVQGVEYRIDPTAPLGARVKDLTWKGRPVRPEDRFTLAVNAYRAQGSGGYVALKRARVLRSASTEIRELLMERLRQMGTVPATVDRNWVVAPDVVWAQPPGSPRSAAPVN